MTVIIVECELEQATARYMKHDNALRLHETRRCNATAIDQSIDAPLNRRRIEDAAIERRHNMTTSRPSICLVGPPTDVEQAEPLLAGCTKAITPLDARAPPLSKVSADAECAKFINMFGHPTRKPEMVLRVEDITVA